MHICCEGRGEATPLPSAALGHAPIQPLTAVRSNLCQL